MSCWKSVPVVAALAYGGSFSFLGTICFLFTMRKILWASPFSLHDTSSGAAAQSRLMLQYLKAARPDDLQIMALSNFIFDNPRGMSRFTDLKEKLKSKEQFFNLQDGGIQYLYVRNHSTAIDAQTGGEQRLFFSKYLDLLKQFKPDVVMGYGGDMLSMTVRAEAARRGIPCVYVLCNASHKAFTFQDCELVLTDSRAAASYYADNFGVNVCPVGTFIEPSQVVAAKREPQYVTLINPVPEKGLGIFVRLALMAQQELPQLRFLVVESRGSFAQALACLHDGETTAASAAAGNAGTQAYPASLFSNVDVAQHTSDVRQIYARTRLLLVPSLVRENWGRVASEAVLNGIPVLASQSGGLPEAVGTGGLCLKAPQSCQRDACRVPSAEEMRPWMDALKQMLSEDYTERCASAAAAFRPELSARRVLELLDPLFLQAAGSRAQLLRSGMLFR